MKCRLPPQIRRLGRNTTHLAAGRIIAATAGDCRVRGGKSKPLPATADANAYAGPCKLGWVNAGWMRTQ